MKFDQFEIRGGRSTLFAGMLMKKPVKLFELSRVPD